MELIVNDAVIDIIFKVLFFFITFFMIKTFLNMICSVAEDSHRREKFKEAKQLYTARKHQHENNPENWKKWRDANYKITDLVEADNYY